MILARSDELKKYPEIGFVWKEPGMAFRVIFFKKNSPGDGTMKVITDTSEKKSVKRSEKKSEKILELIKSNELITISEIAGIIGISGRSVERNLQKLQLAKKLLRVGPDKGGKWKVIDNQ
jgi:predicted HTH transcriptional regulator